MITRRDFLDGIAIAVGAALLPACRRADAPVVDYPPAKTGLRGSHPGSFEVAHQLRDGTLHVTPEPTGEHYDLIVVGGGISGLAAAYYARKAGATTLVLDNHDDVGGHAKRNEFTVDGRTLISNGGTAAIEFPGQYSAVARRLLDELGIDVPRIPAMFPRARHAELGLGEATFFDRETFAGDHLVTGDDDAVLAGAPLADAVRADLARLLHDETDHWPALDGIAKKQKLAKLSYAAFLTDVAKLDRAALPYFQTRTHDLYGVGIDAVPALDCWALGFPGFDGLRLDKEPIAELGLTPRLEMHDEPRWFHFPDGNATIVRLLVRELFPGVVPGNTMEDVVAAPLDYARLDAPGATRIRLGSTAIRARNTASGVEVAYVRDGRAATITGDACVLACWNGVIPYLCPELPEAQRKALAYGVKVPLVYTNVALRGWRAFAKLGFYTASCPGSYFTDATLELAHPSYSPDEPAIVKLERTPCRPGLPAREQHKQGRNELLATSFEMFEAKVRDQLGRMLGAGGFDPARDIAAITVNRWSHGYSYEYNSLWDPEWPPGASPCEIGRRRFGRIAIANADAAAYAYTDAAIDQAWRAMRELSE